ncbi:MAG TPA: transglutaminase family protein [Opitutaceae bacterium]|jgi:transglutaminase-like putative cysteine protease|nr:transglutaminase family protein [Opitutaceae bacterium]HRE08470.1 transglutaminase family protein [Opitutaceae bacterium]
MRFRINHRTHYRYAGTASESFMEARLTPSDDENQKRLSRRLTTVPGCNIHTYADYFGNIVETFSIVQRHEDLLLESVSEVETTLRELPRAAFDISISEARQIFRSERLRLFEFLMPSSAISLSAEVNAIANRFFKPGATLGPALLSLNSWIKQTFRYQPGATRIDTTVPEILKLQAGVCQDFAQLMIAVLRSAEIPARYVTGYIETETQRRASEEQKAPQLVGASESHAWVEVQLPGGFWWPLDPTNDCVAGERHVKVAIGRDYRDTSPTRGVFKGTHTQKLSVAVLMQRI